MAKRSRIVVSALSVATVTLGGFLTRAQQPGRRQVASTAAGPDTVIRRVGPNSWEAFTNNQLTEAEIPPAALARLKQTAAGAKFSSFGKEDASTGSAAAL